MQDVFEKKSLMKLSEDEDIKNINRDELKRMIHCHVEYLKKFNITDYDILLDIIKIFILAPQLSKGWYPEELHDILSLNIEENKKKELVHFHLNS